jgi:hypothetical protein
MLALSFCTINMANFVACLVDCARLVIYLGTRLVLSDYRRYREGEGCGERGRMRVREIEGNG